MKQEMIDFAKLRNLLVDADWLWDYWNDGDWIKANGKPVRSWKQSMWTHHKFNVEQDRNHQCAHSNCKKAGVYPKGKDRDGHTYYYCHDHKPAPPQAPQEITDMAKGLLKTPDCKVVNINDARNKNRKALGL